MESTFTIPEDAEVRRRAKPVPVYDSSKLKQPPVEEYNEALRTATTYKTVKVPPRTGRALIVNEGEYFRIRCASGSQVGDLNLWNADNLKEHFFSGKTRAFHGTHVTVGDRLWSCLPYLRPMATIVQDSLGWYGIDDDGASVHDVIGTRCDPYTHMILKGVDYDQCCHSNLTRALASHCSLAFSDAEPHVHDVLNVFMCTGFARDTRYYFMKASPARAGDYITMLAEIDLIIALSACSGGNCGDRHSSGVPVCYPLEIDVIRTKNQ